MPNGRLFSIKAFGTIRILADLNIIKARAEFDTASRPRRAFAVEDFVDLGRRMLWVEFTKDDEPREIPLSKYAAGYLARLVRYLNTPYVFVNRRTGTRWVNPDKSLLRAAERVGL